MNTPLTERQREVLIALLRAGAYTGTVHHHARLRDGFVSVYVLTRACATDVALPHGQRLPDAHYGGSLAGLEYRGLVEGRFNSDLGQTWRLTAAGIEAAEELGCELRTSEISID